MPGKSALLQRKDHNEKAAIYKPRRKASGKASIVNPLILDLRPPDHKTPSLMQSASQFVTAVLAKNTSPQTSIPAMFSAWDILHLINSSSCNGSETKCCF